MRPGYITSQPAAFPVPNSFDLMGNENLLRVWKYDKTGGGGGGCCCACGCTDSYYVTLTDTRLLLRIQDQSCCKCCYEPFHQDSSIFLRDIAEMRESTVGMGCWACCCARCCPCCSSCCPTPKCIELRGSFGSKFVHVNKNDVAQLQVEIPAAIGNHKLVSQY
jgi:hypothetical protein